MKESKSETNTKMEKKNKVTYLACGKMVTNTPEDTNKEAHAAEKLRDKSKNYTIDQIIKDPTQLFFFVLVVGILLALVPFTIVSYFLIQKYRAEAPEGYDYPAITDFRITFVSAMVIAATQSIFET